MVLVQLQKHSMRASNMSELEVVNVSGTINFQQRIALKPLAGSLAQRAEINRVCYNPSELHLIHSWFFDNDTYVAFYKNGICAITGVDSLDKFYQVSSAVGVIIEEIVDLEIEIAVTITNIVSTAEIKHPPSLEIIAVELGLEQIEYEPEQFPGLIYRDGESVILIFANGKIVCTGFTDLNMIQSAIDDVTDQIENLEVS